MIVCTWPITQKFKDLSPALFTVKSLLWHRCASEKWRFLESSRRDPKQNTSEIYSKGATDQQWKSMSSLRTYIVSLIQNLS